MKDRERQLSDQIGKNKELSVNLHMEQETVKTLKAEKEALEKELRGLKEDINILKQS